MSAQVAAVKAQAKPVPDPVKAAGAQLAKPKSPPAPPRPKAVPLTPMRQQAAKSMRKLAQDMQGAQPDMTTHAHVRLAARQVEKGNEDGAIRHLQAAMRSLSPNSLQKHGIHVDDAHIAARQSMQSAVLHYHMVKDIQDAAAKNQAAVARASYGDQAPPPHPDPNNGYGPGALAQKPTARQPPGDQALNAPARSSSGGSDPAVADPGGPQRPGSKQFARTWDEVAGVLDLVGAGGWEHNWKYVGGPGLPSAASRNTVKVATGRPPGASKQGILSGPHPADRLTVASDPRATARAMSDDDLQRADVELSRRATLLGKAGQQSRGHKAAVAEMRRRGTSMSVTWDDVANVVDLSAKTAALEATPAPRGKPGGPGLYHVAGQEHTNYLQQIVKALIEKRGMPPGKAYAIAYGALRKWAKGGGKVHGEVTAAAAGALAGEKAKVHGHAVTWAEVAAVLEMATVVELFNPAEARVPVGSATAGQFSAGAGAQPAAGQQPAKAKGSVKPPLTKHQLHVLHVAHLLKVSTAKAALLVSAQDDKAKAEGLIKQRDALVKALASAGGKTSTGQAGATTSANATTATTAPAAASTAATTTAASTAPAATAAKTTAAAAPAAAPKAGSAAAMKAQIASLNTQISALLAAAATATAQASKMK
jgi:hypothetical protein